MYARQLFSGIFLLATLAVLTGCQSSGAKTDSVDFSIDYEKYTLDNGLEVILHEDKSDPLVAVAIAYHVGSNREKPGRTGFAHFFEHMLFQNSENVGKGNFFKIVDELGGTFNGGTSNDFTVYYEVVPKDALEKILWMESDRMGFMINTVTTPVLENEKQVVKNEKRQRVDNQPYGHTNYVIDKNLYPEDHPYNWQVIGSLEDLEAATIEDVKEFYDIYYGPNNATMVVAGDIDFTEVKTMVEKYFGEIPAKPEVPALEPRIGKLEATKMLMHEDNFAQLPELRMVWPTVDQQNDDKYALQYLGQLLDDGKRAPLYKVLVEERKLAPSPYAYNSAQEIAGTFTIGVRANAGVDLDSVYTGVQAALKRFEENGIDDKDMERIKNALETDFYNGISSTLSKGFQLAFANEFFGSPDYLEENIRKTRAVTKADVMRVYETYIKDRPFIMTSFVPKGQVELVVEGSTVAEVVEEEIIIGAEAPPLPEDNSEFEKTPSQIDRSTPPELGEPAVVQAPDIWKTKLANGLQVYGIENTELPLVNFSLRVKGSALLEDPAKLGITNLISEVLLEGTANKTPEELEDAIKQLGANLNAYNTQEYFHLSGNCLAKNFEEVMALVEEILLEPRWDETEFDRVKQKTITQIKQRAGQPNAIAGTVFNKLIYGENNIQAMRSEGSEETVSGIVLDDLRSFYDQNFSPTVASFHVAGSVSQSEVKQALERLADEWAAREVALPDLPEPETPEKPQLYFVNIPNAKQSVIYIGRPTVARNSTDYAPLNFVNQKLGGGVTGQLFQTLREEKGYTYGAYSALPSRMNTSYLVALSSVRANVTRESMQTFQDILANYPASFDEETLETTRTMMLRSNALEYETLGDKIGILQSITTFDLPEDYLQQEMEVIRNINLDQAQATIDRYITPDNMIYVVVGDAKTQADRLKGLGLGDPIMLDREGLPVQVMAN